MNPTDAQITERLSRFCGLDEWLIQKRVFPHYLTSLDALRPVLGKLSEEQWAKLVCRLWNQNDKLAKFVPLTQWLLTLPPRTLARDLYEVIGDAP